jgi:hypothetical protein
MMEIGKESKVRVGLRNEIQEDPFKGQMIVGLFFLIPGFVGQNTSQDSCDGFFQAVPVG